MKYTFTLLEIKIPMFTLAEVFRVKPVSKTLSCESITFRLFILEKKKKRQQTYTVLFQKLKKTVIFTHVKINIKLFPLKTLVRLHHPS